MFKFIIKFLLCEFKVKLTLNQSSNIYQIYRDGILVATTSRFIVAHKIAVELLTYNVLYTTVYGSKYKITYYNNKL